MKNNKKKLIFIFLLVSSINLFFQLDLPSKHQNFNTTKQLNDLNLQSSASTNSSDLYAIIIGISDYPGTYDNLQFSRQDAEEFYSLLIDDYGCSPEKIYYLIDSDATYSAIISAFDEISLTIDGNDKFLFYFSGNGFVDDPAIEDFTVDIQTPHDYNSYLNLNWNITHPSDALAIRVHFSKFQTENYYDYLDLGNLSAVGSPIYQERYTGNMGEDFWSGYIPTENNGISLNFRSNTLTTDWGFQIDKYQILNKSSESQGISPYNFDISEISGLSNFINGSLLAQQIQNLSGSQKYVFLDSSFSGGVLDEFTDNNIIIMTSTNTFEFNIEDENSQSGCFSQFLLEGLNTDQYNFLITNEIDSNNDGFNSIKEIFIYSNNSTVQRSQDISEKRIIHPQFYNQNDYDTFIFPAIFNANFIVSGINLNYNFTIDGISYIDSINLLIWSSFDNTFKNYTIDPSSVSESGYGNYSGLINNGKIISSVGVVSQVVNSQNNSSQIFSFQPFDFDNDNLTDIHEIILTSNPTNNDTDGDDLLDRDEFTYNTDIKNNDTDNDSLPDGWEVNYNLNPLDGSDNITDVDEDFVINVYEFLNGTDPHKRDTDGDNMGDFYEIVGLLNPLDPSDKFEDPDNDGMANIYEFWNHTTDPMKPDSDFDGLDDYSEYLNGTDPWKQDTDEDLLFDGDEVYNRTTDPLNPDTDGDYLIDGLEYQYGTNPLIYDTDNDGLSDGDEILIWMTNATNPDTDGDGLSDGEEIYRGSDGYLTDPNNPDTDGDGYSDSEEDFWNTNPEDPSNSPVFYLQIGGFVAIIGFILLLKKIGIWEKKWKNRSINNPKQK